MFESLPPQTDRFAPPSPETKIKYIKISMKEKKRANNILKTLLKNKAEQDNLKLNKFLPEDHASKNHIIKSNGTVNPLAFLIKEKGPYAKKNSKITGVTSIKDDLLYNKELELKLSGLDTPSTQRFYQSEYGCKNEEEMLAKYHENKETENGIVLEKVLTILLDRYLGNNYIVLRTATYDDYKNGVDNLIINKTTGETICAFDGLNEEFDNKRRDGKFEKVKKKTRRGGAKIKYGLKIKDGVLEKQALKNLPVFYLSLTKSELKLLMNNLTPDLNSPITNEEENILKKIFTRFYKQALDLFADNIPRGQIAENIKNFQETIKTLVPEDELKKMLESFNK